MRRLPVLCALIALSLTGVTQVEDDPLDEIVWMVEANLDRLGGNTLAVFPCADEIKVIEGALKSAGGLVGIQLAEYLAPYRDKNKPETSPEELKEL